MTRRVFLRTHAKQAALLSLLLGACSEAGDSEAPRAATAAGRSGAGGGDATGGAAGAAGGVAGDHGHPTLRGGSAGTAGVGGVSGAYTAPACTIVAPTACPDPAPTYADVEPIFTERCVVCHMGSADGPWPLNNYGHIASWSEDIRAMLLECAMPPPEERMPLPNADSSAILTWIRCGMPP